MKIAICEVCGKEEPTAHNHVLRGQRPQPEHLSFVVGTSHLFESPYAVASQLMAAKLELKKYFPGRKFEIVPGMYRFVQNEYSPINYLVLEVID